MFLKSYFLKENETFSLENSKNDSFLVNYFPNEEMLKKFKIDYSKFENIVKNWGTLQSYINLNNKTNYLKTHSAMCTIGPYTYTNKEYTKGAIYLVRDPRDVLVSYSHHLGLDYKKTYELISGTYHFEYPNSKFKDGMKYKKGLIGKWSDHYNSWKNYKFSKVLIIRYEDMINDKYNTFLKILEYLNEIDDVKIKKHKIENALKQTEFNELRKLEEKFGFIEKQKGDFFFRVGKMNEWKKHLTKEIINKIEKDFEKEMKELGYL
tara:strand:+ start:1 stop:792 length:792 start_codon:yes stop_codon:yes gene_type:complete